MKMKVEKICLEELRAVKVLGRGAMGTVFLVGKENGDRLLALKVVSKSGTKKNKAVEVLRRTEIEIDILSSLHHPFLSSLLGVVETQRIIGMVEEYCPGGNLNCLRHNQPEKTFSESAIRFYAAEIVIALEHLHSHGIAYRDLKPENILIQASGHILLTDFDLSIRLSPKHFTVPPSKPKSSKHIKLFQHLPSMLSCLNPSHPLHPKITDPPSKTQIPQTHNTHIISSLPTRSNSFVGTEEYVAPEMLSGMGHDFAVDWWAVGILLYEMVYGRTPFKGATRKLTFYNILINQPHFTGPWTPLRDLMIRLLDKEPSRRLGALNGAQDIKAHPFFKDLKWDTIHHVSRPPFVPLFQHNSLQQTFKNITTPIDIEEWINTKINKCSSNSITKSSCHCKAKKNQQNWVDRFPKGEEADEFGLF